MPKAKPEFTAEMLASIRTAAAMGATDKEIMHQLGVPRSTFYYWRNNYQEFADALAVDTKSMPVERVMRALYNRAVGHDYTEEKIVNTRAGPDKISIRRHLPPDVPAAIAYLRMRGPPDVRRALGGSGEPGDLPMTIEGQAVEIQNDRNLARRLFFAMSQMKPEDV